MVNQQQIEGRWDEIRGKIRERWGQFKGDELDQFKGNVDELIGTIERKTGETREAVEAYLSDLADRSGEAWEQASESAQRAYERAEHMVRARPAESLATLFTCGVLAGVIIGFLGSHR